MLPSNVSGARHGRRGAPGIIGGVQEISARGLRQTGTKRKQDLSIRLISGFDLLGDERLQLPQMGIMNAHILEMLDG